MITCAIHDDEGVNPAGKCDPPVSPVVAPDQRQAWRSARLELVRQVTLGATVSEARRRYPVPMHRSTVYRLLKRV